MIYSGLRWFPLKSLRITEKMDYRRLDKQVMTIFVLSELIRICFAPAGSGGSPTGGGGNRSRDRLKEGLHEVFAGRDQCCWCHILCPGQHRGPGQLCLL